MNEELGRILKMVEGGKITSAEAEKLIDALGLESGSSRAKNLKIVVCETGKDKPAVNLTIPLGWTHAFAPMIARKVQKQMEKHDMPFDESAFLGALYKGEPCTIFDVQDEGNKVLISIE